MRKALAILALLTNINVCQAAPETVYDKHTNHRISYSTRVNAYSGLFDWMSARAFYSSKHGYGIETTYSNYGWIFPREVWSNGRQFKYHATNSDTASCAGAGGCITLESGVIFLSKKDFQQASKAGFDFKLIGTKGAVEGSIASKRFKEVLSQQSQQQKTK